jgi:hypothetical protein
MPLTAASLEDIRREFEAIVAPFEVHPAYKRFATSPMNDGSVHVEQHGHVYAFIGTERGIETLRRETNNPDELLFWLVSDVTVQVARQFELHHRCSGVDSRRMWFDLNVLLLAGIKKEWGTKQRAEYDLILTKHPFKDGA